MTCCWGLITPLYTASKQNVQQMSAQLLVLRYTENEKQSLYVEKISPSCWSFIYIYLFSPFYIIIFSLFAANCTTPLRMASYKGNRTCEREHTAFYARSRVLGAKDSLFKKKMGVKTTSLISVHYTFTKLSVNVFKVLRKQANLKILLMKLRITAHSSVLRR